MNNRSWSAQLKGFVGRRATVLGERYRNGDGAAKATMARLRRSATHSLEDDPSLWAEVYSGFPEELIGHGDKANPPELAVHLALSLFALHQQSRSEDMHAPGVGLGAAVRRLANPNNSEEYEQAALRRFTTLATATSFSEISHHLRGLVKLLRDRNIPLDYGQLAADLMQLNYPERAGAVRLRWARQLYTRTKPAGDATAGNSATAQ